VLRHQRCGYRLQRRGGLRAVGAAALGHVRPTAATLAAEVFRALRAKAAADVRRELVVRVHPDLAAFLETETRDGLEKLAATLDRKITVQAVTGHVHRDEFEVLLR